MRKKWNKRRAKAAARRIAVMALLLGLLSVSAEHARQRARRDYERRVQESRKYALSYNWGLSIPEGFEEVYFINSLDFQGKGYRYSVYRASYYDRITLRAGLPPPADPSQYIWGGGRAGSD